MGGEGEEKREGINGRGWWRAKKRGREGINGGGGGGGQRRGVWWRGKEEGGGREGQRRGEGRALMEGWGRGSMGTSKVQGKGEKGRGEEEERGGRRGKVVGGWRA